MQQIQRELIRDLPLPPAIAAQVAEVCRRLGRREALQFEEEVRLQVHFGGKEVLYLRTPAGRVVVAAGVTDEIAEEILKLTQEERSRLGHAFPEVWGWDQSLPDEAD